MKILVQLITLGCICSHVLTLQYKEQFVDSKIDHFNSFKRNPSLFKQRLLVSDKFFDEKSGPILVYTGNEGSIDSFWNNTGFVMELAQEFRGYIIFIEHRYYGKSLPFGGQWQDNYHYQYLTVEQAIADYAVILTNLKQQLGWPKRKVIAFGGSYGGMLTAYMRFKYPNIVDGGLAASAPIFPMGKYDFYRAVTEDCRQYNPKCPVRVKEAFSQIFRLAQNGTVGYDFLTSKFKLCQGLSATSIQHFLLWIRNAFTTMAMVDYPYPAEFLGKLPAYPIHVACNLILKAGDALTGLADTTLFFYNATVPTAVCHDPGKEYIECADATGCGSSSSQWDIQVCLQIRLPSGTNNITDMFPPFEAWTNSQYEDYCRSKYGPDLSYKTDFFSVDFWSDNIRSASNLIFSNGDLDPWHYGGVMHDIPQAPFIYPILIKGGAHHLDLRASNPRDPVSVTDARIMEKRIIESWLASP